MNDSNGGHDRPAAPAPDRIMVHTFVTANYLAWGELFLESFRRHHGEGIRIRIDGRDLSPDDIALLRGVYGNLEVHNEHVDWDAVARELDVDRATVDRWRTQISRGDVDETNFRIKLFLSVAQRYRSMDRVLRSAREAGYDYVLHSDADVYFRQPLDGLFGLMAEHDVVLFQRPTKKRHAMKVWGGFLGFRTRPNLDTFLDRWMGHIDAVPAPERWKGFGQSVLWFAIQDSDDLAIGDLSGLPDAPGYSKEFDTSAALWLGNSSLVGPTKVITRRRFWDDLKGGLPRIPLERVTLSDWWGTFMVLAGLALQTRWQRLCRLLPGTGS
ncbi:hypothetical protein V6X62_02715 [Spiribacter sp. 218]|uniref:hypothetical protein n=1 Tax=Spiribacter pallidus TaxID=1987936 RepID=UPI00349FB3E0